jgi:branched-chain amino acid transport system ATP-binding protein
VDPDSQVNPAAEGADVVLETRLLSRRFGGITATNQVSLAIRQGARHALIGPNGAGKTTLVNLLSGVLRPSGGSILLDGADITRLAAPKRVERGLVRTFQINQLFGELTPLQSLALAVGRRLGTSARWWQPMGAGGDDGVTRRCDELLDQFYLRDVMNQRVAALPYGKRRLLEIALAVACRPRVLLLDEPVAGVPEGERRQILDTVDALPADVAIVLIEHDMDLVFNFANRVTVLVDGAVFVEGDAASVARDPRVRAVYLGESRETQPLPEGPHA